MYDVYLLDNRFYDVGGRSNFVLLLDTINNNV